MRKFVDRLNYWGAERIPFFFLVDFEMKHPIAHKLEHLKDSDISLTYNGVEYGAKIDPSQMEVFTVAYSNFETYRYKFNMVQEALSHGDTYLLNLTAKTLLDRKVNLDSIYCNSSAKFKLLKKGEFVCFSPERFLTIEGDRVSSFPMKGTINANSADAQQRLMNDCKELFEHYTIVDLIRNDLSIISQGVEVDRFRYLDKISTSRGAILQTSSEVYGTLPEDWRSHIGDVLLKELPAGSVSGAPKRRTTELIRSVEGEDRGYYTGVFGVFDGDNLYSAVAIRFVENCGEESFYRSGGGITSLSSVEEEYAELIQKIYVPTV